MIIKTIPQNIVKNYFKNILLFLIIAVLMYLLYPSIFRYLIERGLDNQINAILLLGIISYLLYKNIDLILNTDFKSRTIPGLIILILSFIILYYARLKSGFMLTGISFLVSALGIVVLILGYSLIKYIIIPIIFLAIGFDVFEFFLVHLSFYFQYIIATIASSFLNIIGIYTIQSDTVLYLPHITLLVEPGCNGINHLSALVLMSLIIVFVQRKSIKHNIILPLIAFILGFVLNSMRVALIGVWALFFKGDLLHGPGNIFYVTFVFTIGSIILLLISSIIATKKINPQKINTSYIFKIDKKQLLQAQLITAVVLTIGLIFLNYLE